MINIYTDGSCKGNPGKCGYAFTVYQNNDLIYVENNYLGYGTNNIAEWMAIYKSLEWLNDNKHNSATLYTDSKLVINQMKGEWKIKKPQLKVIHSLCSKFSHLNVNYIWVKAHNGNEKNEITDKLAKASIKIKLTNK